MLNQVNGMVTTVIKKGDFLLIRDFLLKLSFFNIRLLFFTELPFG